MHFRYVSQYVLKGDRFYDQDTILFVHCVFQVSDPASPDAEITFAAINTVPDISDLTPLDPSGAFILQASIEIADGNSTELKDRASQQLLAMKEILRFSVDLAPGDRLALDARIPMKRGR